MTATVTQLGYIAFGVSDTLAWDAYLTRTLGLQGNGTTAGGVNLYRMDEHRSRVHVLKSELDDLAYIGWYVKDRAALRSVEERLSSLGFSAEQADPGLAAERGVIEIITVTDPCGLVNEISYGPALELDKPFVAGRPMSRGFVTGDQGVGHVVLKSHDPEAYVRFYEDGLGLALSDQVVGDPGFAIAFYHANARHHSIAFPLIALPPMGKRIQHFMVQLEDLDDVGRGQDVAQENGELLNYLGRHTNDHMVSCYIGTPSGFGVEYGWGALELSPDAPAQLHKDGGMWGHSKAGDRSIFDIVIPDGPMPEGFVPGGPPPGVHVPEGVNL